MRKISIILAVCFLLAVSFIPWLLSGCNPNSLVPEELVQKPRRYEATVRAAQNATIEANRQVTSAAQIILIGTMEPPRNGESGTGMLQAVQVSTVVITTGTASEWPVSESTPTSTPAPVITSIPEMTPTAAALYLPPTPMGMINIEDVITAEMLTEQLKSDAAGNDLTDLKVSLSPDGIHVEGAVVLLKGFKQSISADGTFEVKDYSLIVNIQLIKLGDKDVTQQYDQEMESRVETSLYRLLPGRYVQKYQFLDGTVLVYSMKKP